MNVKNKNLKVIFSDKDQISFFCSFISQKLINNKVEPSRNSNPYSSRYLQYRYTKHNKRYNPCTCTPKEYKLDSTEDL